MSRNIQESEIFSGKQINASSGAIKTLTSLLGATDAAVAKARAIAKIHVKGHGASFYYGNSDLSDKATQATPTVYERECNADHLDNTSVRATANTNITGVIVEVFWGR